LIDDILLNVPVLFACSIYFRYGTTRYQKSNQRISNKPTLIEWGMNSDPWIIERVTSTTLRLPSSRSPI